MSQAIPYYDWCNKPSDAVIEKKAMPVKDILLIIGIVVFSILLFLSLLTPIWYGVGTTEFKVACVVGTLSFFILATCIGLYCTGENEEEQAPLINNAPLNLPNLIPQGKPLPEPDVDEDIDNLLDYHQDKQTDHEECKPLPDHDLVPLYEEDEMPINTEGDPLFHFTYHPSSPLTKNLPLPEELKSPFSLKLWGIVKGYQHPDAVRAGDLCPKLEYLYEENGEGKYHLKTDEIVERIDKISAELKAQKDAVNQDLGKRMTDPAKRSKALDPFNKDIDQLVRILEARKGLLVQAKDKALSIQEIRGLPPLSEPFIPLRKSMHDIEYLLGINYSFAQHLQKLITNIAKGSDRYQLQTEAELCRDFFSSNDADFNCNKTSQKGETVMFGSLFEYLFAGYEFSRNSQTEPNGLKDIPELRYCGFTSLRDKKTRDDGTIEGTYAGQKWVVLSLVQGASTSGGHYVNHVYQPKKGTYLTLDNMDSDPSEISAQQLIAPASSLLGLVAEKFNIGDKPEPDLVPDIDDIGNISYEADPDAYEARLHYLLAPNSDRACVIMEVGAFNKIKDRLTLPTVSPAYQSHNCYLAAALVRLSAFYQAARLLNPALALIPPKK